MEGERGHHHRSELFICFTSRPPSLKTSSKSTIPGRPDKPTSSSSLSTSLSRRLRSNGSIKGGQSPMFPASVSSTQRKKGGAFEAPEPSSPKVTCIGQVRVKTMKKNHHHKNHLRSRSRRRGGEVSFRKGEIVETTTECLPSRNQRWVHLPLSVCEALRAFGAEISCLFPSCGGGGERRGLCGFGRERGEKKKRKRRGFWVGGGSCGAALARWLMVVEEEEKRVEEMGMVVRRREEEDVVELVEEEGMVELVEVVGDGEEEEKRVSICIPPRNALLLMRCRSDPWKMSALTSKFWGSSEEVLVGGDDDEDEDDDDDDGDDEVEEEEDEEEKEMERLEEDLVEVNGEVENPDLGVLEEVVEGGRDGGKEEEELVEAIGELENPQEEEEIKSSIDEISGGEEKRVAEEETQSGSSAEVEEAKMRDGSSFPEVQETHQSSQAEAATQTEQDIEKAPPFHEDPLEAEAEEAEEARAGEEEPVQPPPHDQKNTDEKRGAMPPECLLLMMCEPKLSMEVSKETWVETADFLRPRRRLPPVNKEPTENPISAAPAPPPPAPPPSSMATAVEQRLVSASAHEPFVLTRCKSEPMRSSAKLAPQACFWKARHRPIGAAGLGF
ncbi:hypothetical protein QJS10_CPB20g01897 [Acorus calamus]|uniref:Uncharacterized protein n=1 Tax=Acorus calamus TaxID=4465 RepID=A0AAV9CAU4_ACOCL|nr:hypothetical protein QJS10_CPB20g01890 [Acorus calamus]KAK1285785.1 hypothetical protein QJS10_CPB20g01897 [Acorus calamus]